MYAELEALLLGIHTHPHHFLGIHPHKKSFIVRALNPKAECGTLVLPSGESIPMKKVDPAGLFEAILPEKTSYRLQWGSTIYEDPYRFSPTWTKEDIYLFNQGNHHRVYKKLGAHLIAHEGVEGCAFAVWAPNAKRVSVVGDFNAWDGRKHPMRHLGSSGVWELFIPDIKVGEHYKYEIYDANEQIQLKSDPYGLMFEQGNQHASIIVSEASFAWTDETWLNKRAQTNAQEAPMAIYELHLDSWRHRTDESGTTQPLTYHELADELIPYLQDLGFTHVEFMPIAEYPFLGSWGYQVTGFFAPTSRYGTPEDLMYLINALHAHQIGVIIDWVPGHFPKDAFALAHFDGTALYEHADPRQGEQPDWNTLIFNYGRNEVRNFLISSALAWLDRFHVDGLRVDAVASMLYLDYSRKEGEWIPNRYGGKENLEAIDLLRTVNDLVHQYHRGVVTIAEESTSFGRVSQPTSEYGLGFDFKWNMGWMHDVLGYCQQDPLFRKYHHNEMTFGMLYQYSEHFINVFSHDEVVHGKGSLVNKMGSFFFDDKISTLRALYAYMWGWPGKKTLFMGSEIGQVKEWDYQQALEWCLLQYPNHSGIQHLIRDLNKLYRQHDFWYQWDEQPGGFEWIDPDDHDNSVFSFIRKHPHASKTLLFVSNFTPVERINYALGVPFAGYWRELLNTDAACYNGKNRGNLGGVYTQATQRHGRPQHVNLYLPPLSTLIFEYDG